MQSRRKCVKLFYTLKSISSGLQPYLKQDRPIQKYYLNQTLNNRPFRLSSPLLILQAIILDQFKGINSFFLPLFFTLLF